MASITITVPNDKVVELTNALGYQTEVHWEPNPQTRGDFAKMVITSFLKKAYRDYKRREAESLIQSVDIDIT